MAPGHDALAFPALLLTVAAGLLGHGLAALAFQKRTAALVTGLGRATGQGMPASEVPAIIQAYARRAAPGGPLSMTVHLRQRGEMRLKPSGPWRPRGTVEVSAASSGDPARVRLIFEGGDIVRVEADDRPYREGSRTALRRWVGRFHDYREVSGYRIPTRGKVEWVLDDGPFAYWRDEVTNLEVE